MPAMPMKYVKQFKLLKEHMSVEQKKKLLTALKTFKEEYTGNVGGETDIANPDNLTTNEYAMNSTPERKVVAKTFDTQADFDSYVNQRRGIQITPKERQAIIGYKQALPTQEDPFFVKFETTDAFGLNSTTIIKKLKEGPRFCWTAFSKHESAEEEAKPAEPGMNEVAPSQPSNPQDSEVTVDDPIRITKTTTFANDTDGANVLGDFLRKLDI